MNGIKLADINYINEHSYVSVRKPDPEHHCHICGKSNVKTINCDNSECDNISVALCLECCTRLLTDN